MKYAFLIALPLALAACTSTPKPVLISTTIQVIDVPKQFLDCDRNGKPKVPNHNNLVDSQIGELIVKQDKVITECFADAKSARKFQSEFRAGTKPKK